MKIKLVPSAKNNLAANFWQLYSNEAMHWLAARRRLYAANEVLAWTMYLHKGCTAGQADPALLSCRRQRGSRARSRPLSTGARGGRSVGHGAFSSGVWCSLDFETVMRQSGRQRGLFCTWNSKLASHRKKDTHSHSFTWGWSARGRMWTHWVTTTPFSKEELPKLMVQSIVNRKSCELRSDFYASQTDLSANLLCSLNAGILISFYQEKLHFFQEICAQYFS